MAAASPDAIALLKADHQKVASLFAQFEAAKGAERRKRLATQICTELTIHTTIEEEIFYPACRGHIDDDLLQESYVEHDGAKVLIAEIKSGNPDDAFYAAKVKVLSEQIEHHVEEEERRSKGMFAQARAAGVDVDDLGVRMLARKQSLTAQFKVSGLPSPKTRTFTGHELDRAGPVQASQP